MNQSHIPLREPENPMLFLVRIDQAQCIRFGIEANQVEKIPLSMTKLPGEIRNFIAERFWKGWILDEPITDKPHKQKPMMITVPTPGGLVGEIALRIGYRPIAPLLQSL